MKFTTITAVLLSSLLSTTAAIDPAVNGNSFHERRVQEIEDRQVAGAMETQNLIEAESILNSARSSSVGKIRGRRLRETQERQCSKQAATECNKCMDALVQTAIFEVMGCGVAALGVGALSGGAASALAAMGFLACDGTVYGSYEKGLVECRAF
ncbi:hypothetical protein COL940_008036 [Colletotrichum noveboracense]|nr:hypothetical protein COL940_008036 [Colletotrichum noveboracense]KAJ0283916.1 hypothetical protein CBS470a_007097 [Colletotrichum nupharicola]